MGLTAAKLESSPPMTIRKEPTNQVDTRPALPGGRTLSNRRTAAAAKTASLTVSVFAARKAMRGKRNMPR